MTFKKHIPNLITLLNLLCGTIATILAVQNELVFAAYFVLLGILFDFFDGFAARLLNVQGELGKQLDSLADVVTSGVVPGIVMFQLIVRSIDKDWVDGLSCEIGKWVSYPNINEKWIAFLGLLITLGAAYRLAKFNIDERQTSSFIGLPTPAASIFVLSLPLILEFSSIEIVESIILNKWFLIGITLVLTYIMNAEIPLFSLKFKNYSWKSNQIKYVFIGLTIISIVLLKVIAVPFIILLYVLLSVFENSIFKQK
ncbi:CDP-diacylglycerol---serine O-phosphatidyltransferase [Lutibacter oricola]|uniref:CDP-diacylglycerol---serine O-phosphatidyltransferase n=1 Tax=Lutibacter oricola TaxID=762486 RepID=A0A1H2XSN3_9FLAO|nr:CDP-alcohol phosphatidyltransferase family protein [Lutibacter oricola]SDW95827.1 CDP-diacylglycerol---serine O-phosphatidyltransferase [Lutibacter oricola]